jgi:hypothetical protein
MYAYVYISHKKFLVLVKELKTKLGKLFPEDDWIVLNPRGKGWCLLYAIYGSLEIETGDMENDLFKSIKNKLQKDEEIIFEKSDGNIIIITKNDDDATIKEKLTDILNDNNLSHIFIDLLSKYYNVNVLLLTRDSNSGKPYGQHYFTSDLDDPRYLILLNTAGHYVSVIPEGNPLLKNTRIHEIRDGSKKW